MSIAATIDVGEAARQRWDVVVIGAGPAGALAARQLARLGVSTLLVDRKAFPRAKVCGGCLNGRAIATLRRVGLGDLLAACGAVPLRRFVLRSSGREVSLPLPAGAALSRETLDAELVRAAIDAGAMFLPETTAAVAPLACVPEIASKARRAVRLTVANGQAGEIETSVILAADGLGHRSLPAGEFPERRRGDSRIGLGASFHDHSPAYGPGVIYMAVGREGYVGLVRTEDGRLNVAAAIEPSFVKRCGGPAACIADVLREAGFALPGAAHLAAWHGTLELTRRSVRVAGRRVLLLGDAAGYVEPFTGEGIGWAFEAAAAVPEIAIRGLRTWSKAIEQHWTKRYHQLVQRRQVWCRGLAWWLRRPGLVEPTMRFVRRFPDVSRPLIRRLSGPDATFFELSTSRP